MRIKQFHSLARSTQGLHRFWRWAIPFRLFRDASCGSKEQRQANYRYNRSQRDILPVYTLRWMAIAAGMLLLLNLYSGMLSHSVEGTFTFYCAALFCVSTGIVFSFACIAIVVLMACHLFLAHSKE